MISENIKRIKERIAEAAVKAGRDPAEITLVAATKAQSAESVREAIIAGVGACGENRVQELVSKNLENAYAGSSLHFIGHLQRNKIKQVVGTAELIQSVDSLELARLIGIRAAELGITQNILLEVNVGNELSKNGFSPDMLGDAVDEITEIRSLQICGLMTIPPITADMNKNHPFFRKMLKLYIDNCAKIVHNERHLYLSMGMSGDYYEAIQCGSNMVRIGTAIFGLRN